MGAYNDISDLAGTRRLGRDYTLFLRYTPFKRKRKRYSPDDKKKFQTLPYREPAILRTGTPCRHTFICRLLVEKTLVQFPTKSVRHIILSHTYFLYTSPDNYRSLWSSYKLKRGNIWFRQTDFAKPCIGLSWRNVSKIKNGLPCVYEIPRRVYPSLAWLNCHAERSISEVKNILFTALTVQCHSEWDEVKWRISHKENVIARDLSPVFDTTNIWPLSSNRRPRKKSMHRPYKAKRGYQRQHNDTTFFFYLTTSLLS